MLKRIVVQVCWKEGRRSKVMGVKEAPRLGGTGGIPFLSPSYTSTPGHIHSISRGQAYRPS